jgi:hypothetical protein
VAEERADLETLNRILGEMLAETEPGVTKCSIREVAGLWFGFVVGRDEVDPSDSRATYYGPYVTRREIAGILEDAGFWEPIGPEEEEGG